MMVSSMSQTYKKTIAAAYPLGLQMYKSQNWSNWQSKKLFKVEVFVCE